MRLYGIRDNKVVPHYSLQEATQIRQSVTPRLRVWRNQEVVGWIDCPSGKFNPRAGIEFSADGDEVSLVAPEQGASHG